ncbi:NAD(P)H-hydrate dehydratase [Planococcus sp. APC 4015]|nr:NAD(P)H-hydrate dehydratase [Planococcus sp. APC 4015]
MSNPDEIVTEQLLRSWGLPDPGSSKKTRGRVIVVGGSRRTPGAVVLAAEAALRVGAGRLGVVVPQSVDAQLGAVIPEAAVFALPEDASQALPDGVRDEIGNADAVLVGPGFDDIDETRSTLLAVLECGVSRLVLDAYALGVINDIPRDRMPDEVIVNANEEEAAILLGRALSDDRLDDLREIAERDRLVVQCYGDIVEPGGRSCRIPAGGPGLGTSGSGDVLAGAITGFAARGLEAPRAAAWGAWAHATAGDSLTERTGLGFLARDLAAQLTVVVNDVFR